MRYHPFGYLSANKLPPARLGQRTHRKSSVCLCFRSPKKPKAVQTVKLTPDHRVSPTGAIYRHSIRRNEPNRPHISSVIQQCQRAKHQEPKTRPKRQSLSATASPKPKMPTVSPVRPAVSPACPQHLSAAGEGLFTDYSKHPQPPNTQKIKKIPEN